MPSDPDLETRGRLIRTLGTLREMLPGSFVERRRACGRPNCHCTDGQNLHVFDAVFLGAAMQIPSLLQIEAECRGGALAKRIGPISDDPIGCALQRQSPNRSLPPAGKAPAA